MSEKNEDNRGNKDNKVIIIQYKTPLRNLKKTELLDGECTSNLRDRQNPEPVFIIRIDKRIRGFRRFETLVHEFVHRACEEVFGYQGDESIVEDIAVYARDEYEKYLKRYKTIENTKSLKTIGKKAS